MSKYLVVGAGPIGSGVARQLAARGNDVIVATRSGSGPEVSRITRVKADAGNVAAMTELADGTAAVFNCVNPPYTSWERDWPPMADAMLAAATTSGAVLATCSNLYAYGPIDGPIRTDHPLAAKGKKGQVRARMFEQAMAANERGDVRATEVRSSDYLGPGAQSHLGDRVVPRLLAGKGVRVVGNPDMSHSWTYTEDAARTLVEAATNPAAWGRAWHTPSNPVRTQREVINDLAVAADVPEISVSGMSMGMLRAAGIFMPMVRELKETYYQFNAPYILDDFETRDVLGIEPTPWSTVLTAHLGPFITGRASTSRLSEVSS